MSAYPNQKSDPKYDESRKLADVVKRAFIAAGISSTDNTSKLDISASNGTFNLAHITGHATLKDFPQTGEGIFTGVKIDDLDDKDDDGWHFNLAFTNFVKDNDGDDKGDDDDDKDDDGDAPRKKSQATLKLLDKTNKLRGTYVGIGVQKGFDETPLQGSWVWK